MLQRMSVAASAHPAPKPCLRSRGELDNLNAKYFQQPVWSSLFFTNVPGSANLPDGTQKFSPRNDLAVNEVRCSECGKTIGEHLPDSPPIHQAVAEQTDSLIFHQMRRELRDGLKIFGTVHASRAKDVKTWNYPCVVCGWTLNSEQKNTEEYRGAAARSHPVSAAHILRSASACGALGLAFDASNFLPLCGHG